MVGFYYPIFTEEEIEAKKPCDWPQVTEPLVQELGKNLHILSLRPGLFLPCSTASRG